MRLILVIGFSLSLLGLAVGQDDDEPWVWPTGSDYPAISASSDSCEGFLPVGWKVLGKAEGDLNKDKNPDCVLIVQGNSDKFRYKNDELGGAIFDTNPRVLIIAFKDEGGFRLVEQNNKFIISSAWPTMTEPFQEVAIAKGVLTILFEEFYSAGSWGMSNTKYTFRFQGGDFALIGLDKTSLHRATGDLETRSYNFSTSKLKIETGNIGDDGKGKITWKTFRVRPLKTLKTLPRMLEWEIEKGRNI